MGFDINAYIAWGIDLSSLSWQTQEKVYSGVWDGEYEEGQGLEVLEFGYLEHEAEAHILTHSEFNKSTKYSLRGPDSVFSLDKFPPPPDDVVEKLKQCVLHYVSDSDDEDDDDISADDLEVKLHFGYALY